MAFKALKKRLERGDISDPHTYIELYAEAYDRTGEEDDAVDIADHLYNDLPPATSTPSLDDLAHRQLKDTMALRDYMDRSATENAEEDEDEVENEDDETPDIDLAFGATGGGETFPASSSAVGD